MFILSPLFSQILNPSSSSASSLSSSTKPWRVKNWAAMAAACGSLQHMFEKPSMPESPTLFQSLSSPLKNRIRSPKPIDDSSLADFFAELLFKESCNSNNDSSSDHQSLPSPSSLSSSYSLSFPAASSHHFSFSSTTNVKDQYVGGYGYHHDHSSDSFSSMNSDHSLQLCTEGLGFESSDEMEELNADMSSDRKSEEDDRITITTSKQWLPSSNNHESMTTRRSNKKNRWAFPPPITNIGQSGKPWVSFKSYRQDGRFVLKEVRIPNHEFLHASREDGRLKLQLVQSDDEALEDEDDDDDDDGENKEHDSDIGGDISKDEEEEGEGDEYDEGGLHGKNVELKSNAIGGHP